MKTIKEIRRENARSLASEGPADFARKIESTTQQVNQTIGPNPTRNIGDNLARRIESHFGLPTGWLDVEQPAEAIDVKAVSGQPPTKEGKENASPPANVTHLPEARIPVGDAQARRVYVVGRANGGLPERIWTDGGYLVGATEEYAIQATDDPHAFLTPIVGTSMSPVYNPGDFAFVEPSTEVEAGDDVLVRLTSGETMLKRLRSSHNGVQLESYNEPGTLFFRPDEISWMYYVAHPVRRKKIKTRF